MLVLNYCYFRTPLQLRSGILTLMSICLYQAFNCATISFSVNMIAFYDAAEFGYPLAAEQSPETTLLSR